MDFMVRLVFGFLGKGLKPVDSLVGHGGNRPLQVAEVGRHSLPRTVGGSEELLRGNGQEPTRF
jgi:hypothetical protein